MTPEKNWEYVATPTEIYRYRIGSTGDSSHKYGECMICGGHATEVYIQVEERKYFDSPTGDQNWFEDFLNSAATYTGSDADQGWTQNKCTTLFGHYDCLVAGRRK